MHGTPSPLSRRTPHRVERGSRRPGRPPVRVAVASLDLRDKFVAAGLAVGTALVVTMLGLEKEYVLALCALAPVFLLGPIRDRLFGSHGETFQAYYVAWLYGPLGWGLYREVRWAQIVGLGLALVVALAIV